MENYIVSARKYRPTTFESVVGQQALTQTLRNPSTIGLNANDLVMNPGIIFTLTTIFIIVTGTMFLMWIGDQITERGVGNGISLIISVNIIHALPGAFAVAWKTCVMKGTEVNPLGSLFMVALILFMVLVVALVVIVSQAQRRIPVQYAKRVVGRKMYGGQSTHLPIKVNMSGVMPVIFAQSIASLPATICTFAGMLAIIPILAIQILASAVSPALCSFNLTFFNFEQS